MHTVPVTARCPCGEIVIWDEDTVTSETLLFCKECGAELGTYGELEDRAAQAVADRIESLFRDGE